MQWVETALTDSQVAAFQVQELDMRNREQKDVVADSLFGNHIFLAVCLLVKTIIALVSLRGIQVFYERPSHANQARRVHWPKYAAKFKLSAPCAPPIGAKHSCWVNISWYCRPGKVCI